ncbi:glycine N-acyltransferase-like protein 3 [Haliotis asinina]|uniref:glycine N-acyltransferase-like protein 3 n=1 Tax=Haliotis asinina TaxID=109174 RepID=UPI003531AA7A
MAVTLTETQLAQVLQQLKTCHRWIKVAGDIEATLEHRIRDQEFLVDRWPDYRAMVVQAKQGDIKLKYLRPIVDLYATDVDALRDLLQQLDWSKEKRFECVDSTLTPVLTEVAQLHRTLTREIYDCVYLIVTQDTLKLRPVPEGCVMSTLKADDAALVDSTWDLRSGDVSGDYIRHLITTLPTTCLYNQEGEVMGYALTYHYGCLGVLYVPEKYRGKGYGKVAMSHLVQKHLQEKKEVLVMIQRVNIPSIKMHEGIGFTVLPYMRYDWIFCE